MTDIVSPEKEREILELWEREDAFKKLVEKNRGKPHWSFLDGPITANNPMGVHHAWGRTLKDVYQRFHAMRGFDQRFQNGFDCQGLWVEVEVEREKGFTTKKEIEDYGLEKFVNDCKQRVLRFSKVQTDQSIRLGYWMDWDDSYFTMSDENNYTIWSFLQKCHQRGLVYKGFDSMTWCPRCGTGISKQEVSEGYKEIEDQAVYAKLPLLPAGDEAADPDVGLPAGDEFLLVWTTTPWTLLANLFCAVHPELDYVKVRQGGEIYYLSKERTQILKEKGPFEVLETLKGADLVGRRYRGPFDHYPVGESIRDSHQVIVWDEVSATDGTGIVHIAPGCGKEDFELGKALGIPSPEAYSGRAGEREVHPILSVLDEAGRYQDGYGPMAGQFAGDVAEAVFAELRQHGTYYKKETFSHSYPHCWRCKEKLLFRTVDEWYIDMSWRDEIKDVVEKIRWIPPEGRKQERAWLDQMGDWMISKKRYWGLALPIWDCRACGHFEVIGGKEELRERAVAGWEEFEGNSPHRPWIDAVKIHCSQCGEETSRIQDVGNPWLDAGIVPYSTVRYGSDREYWEKWFPADLVLESFPGQFRNWFYALLAMSTMMENRPPFKTLLGYATMRDENGKMFSKSSHMIRFEEAAEKVGVDPMRWLYCRHTPELNLNFGYGLVEHKKRTVLATWANVFSFFERAEAPAGFDPRHPAVAFADRPDIDRWVLSRLQELIRTGNEQIADFAVHTLVRAAEEFIEDLSNWYLRRSRQRFKSEDENDRAAAYQTLFEVLSALCKVVAPVVPFTTEAMYQKLFREHEGADSVHLCDYPAYDAGQHDAELATEMDFAKTVVTAALAAREQASIRVRQPLSQVVVVTATPEQRRALERFESQVLDEINIKSLRLDEAPSPLVEYRVKPNFKLLGAKYGREMGAVQKALAGVDPLAARAAKESGEPFALAGDGGSWELLPEEIEVDSQAADGYALREGKGFAVLLDVAVDDELEREGIARDFVRGVQQVRKDLDLEYGDRIRVVFETDSEQVTQALDEHREHIATATLCDELIAGEAADGQRIKAGSDRVVVRATKVGE